MTSLIKLTPIGFRNKYRSKWSRLKNGFLTIFGKFIRIFVRPSVPQLKDNRVNLHLGCGSIDSPDFINVDGRYGSHIHYIRSIKDLSPFKDNSVDLIYASHCLEHFSHHQVSTVLNEWFRVLKQDGILRLAVPDFDCLVNIYQKSDRDIQAIQGMLMGGQDYKYNFHMAIFNYASLKTHLKDVGFKRVKKWQPENTKLTNFDDCSKTKVVFDKKVYFVSLNVEAIK